MTADVAGRLAGFILATAADDLPDAARERGEILLIDALACAFAGRHASSRPGFAAAARAMAGAGHSPVVDDTDASPYAAALLNGWQVTATTMCDVYRPRMLHVSPVVLPAVLENAGGHRADAVLAAFVMGVETALRLADTLESDLYTGARWHAPGVVGAFGAVAAAARLRAWDERTLRSALGGALLHAAGTFAAIGSPGVKLTQARAAAAGVFAVEMAERGHGGNPDFFSHPAGGLQAAYGGTGVAPDTALDRHWLLQDLSLRRWPAASSLQSVVEATLRSAEQLPEEGWVVELPSPSYRLCADKDWRDELTALQSARWVTAVVSADRRCGVEQFAPARLADPGVAEVASRVSVVECPELPAGGARVRVGTQVVNEVLAAPGSPERPVERDDIEFKLVTAAGARRAREILAAVSTDGDALRMSVRGQPSAAKN